MFAILERAVAVLLAQGPLGVVVLAQAYWIWKLNGQLSVIQEKRVQDAYRLAETATKCAGALERNTDVLSDLTKTG